MSLTFFLVVFAPLDNFIDLIFIQGLQYKEEILLYAVLE